MFEIEVEETGSRAGEINSHLPLANISYGLFIGRRLFLHSCSFLSNSSISGFWRNPLSLPPVYSNRARVTAMTAPVPSYTGHSAACE